MIDIDFIFLSNNLIIGTLFEGGRRMKAEPAITDGMKALMSETEDKARARGHNLGEWKWNKYSAWYANCQDKECRAYAWVSPTDRVQPTGGDALFDIRRSA